MAIFKRLGFDSVRIVTLSEGEIIDLHAGLKGTQHTMHFLSQKIAAALVPQHLSLAVTRVPNLVRCNESCLSIGQQ